MGREEHKEQMRCQVERFLASDMGVAEWCARNKVGRQVMYYWLSAFAKEEPELFGGRQNVVSSDKRRWVESTRKNMAGSRTLATVEPAEIVIVDSATPTQTKSARSHETSASSVNAICIDIKGASVSIPQGTDRVDIENVLGVVAAL